MAHELTPLEKLAALAIKTDQDTRLAARQRATLAITPPQPREEDTPKALVLVTTVCDCVCGAVWPSPNAAVLLRYDGAGCTNSVHYRREDLACHLHLPREHKTLERSVPFCERCFDLLEAVHPTEVDQHGSTEPEGRRPSALPSALQEPHAEGRSPLDTHIPIEEPA